MFTRLQISKLFDLYNYDLDFTNEDGRNLKILTGPNGFGKTTILVLINALYNSDFTTIANVRFESLIFHFDEKKLAIKQRIEYDNVIGADDGTLKDVILTCTFYNKEDNKEGESFSFSMNEGLVSSGSLSLVLLSLSCYFITDKRLVHKKNDVTSSESSLDDQMVNNVASEMLKLFQAYGGIDKLPADKRRKVDAFEDIIKRSKFADKDLKFDMYSGIRFKMKTELGEYISLSQLSSGEKHILIQAYELLFKAKDGMVALVDEPELSFHPAWLNQYVDNLLLIQEVKKVEGKTLQIILATHSPQLIGQRWDLCLDLYEKCIR